MKFDPCAETLSLLNPHSNAAWQYILLPNNPYPIFQLVSSLTNQRTAYPSAQDSVSLLHRRCMPPLVLLMQATSITCIA